LRTTSTRSSIPRPFPLLVAGVLPLGVISLRPLFVEGMADSGERLGFGFDTDADAIGVGKALAVGCCKMAEEAAAAAAAAAATVVPATVIESNDCALYWYG